jgi:nitrogen-specific signal transduction histidine kinase
MTLTLNPPRNAGAPRVWRSFVIIVLGFVLSVAVSIYEMRNSQAQIRLIARHAATNIELVSRLSRDLDRKRFLIEIHIREKDPRDMDRIEAELANIEAAISGTTNSYEPVDVNTGEHSVWQELVAGIAALEPQVMTVISLSRNNADDEAQVVIRLIDEQFERIDQAANSLLDLNHALANHEASYVRELQRHALVLLAGLTVVWTGFALLTGRWVTRLIAERQHRMEHAMDLLEERNRELDAFAGRVAHDLRGPLTTINLAASECTQRWTGEQSISGVLRRGVAQMEAIIHDLLALSRISTQTIGTICQMTDVATHAQEDLAPKVEALNGVLQIDVDPATVTANKGLLRQVLWNLGENAIKYRRQDVPLRLEITGRTTRDSYELTVSDNGSGMSPSVSRQAFEPFFRGTETESASGTGLGLSVVKRVVEASGGNISVDSEIGRGTTFRIRLPIANSRAA